MISGILSLIVISMVVAAAVTDFRWQKIPNKLTFSGMAIGIVGHGYMHGIEGVGFSLAGLGLGLILLLGFYAMGGMAAGDVKMLAAVGAFLGPLNVFLVFLMTSILGGLYALGIMVQELGFLGMLARLWLIIKTLFITGKLTVAFLGNAQEPKKLRYGLVIALGTLTFQFWYWVGVA